MGVQVEANHDDNDDDDDDAEEGGNGDEGSKKNQSDASKIMSMLKSALNPSAGPDIKTTVWITCGFVHMSWV